MKSAIEHDVIVVGAGPAGNSTAIRLAEIGLDAAIVERLSFPRAQVGICISDQTLALIRYLGLGEDFRNAGFLRRELTAVDWGGTGTRFIPQAGFHVDRAVLDDFMLNKARAAGVKVYNPVRVLEIQSIGRSGWRVTIDGEDGRQALIGRFIVDAAGRRPALRGSRIKDSPPLIAVHAEWMLQDQPEFDGMIESGRNAWLWYAQTARDQAVVSVFCDPRCLGAELKGDLQSRYVGLLQQFQSILPDQFAQQCSEPCGCDAASHHSSDPVSNRHIRVGDACLSVDPLSSQGVHLAIQSGVQAAIIVNTILQKSENTDLAKQFYQLRTTERVNRYTAKTRSEYARVSAVRLEQFWHQRAGKEPVTEPQQIAGDIRSPARPPPAHVTVSSEAIIRQAPVIEGVFVEEREVLSHPNIEGNVAYVDGANLITLLAALPRELSYRTIPEYWREQIPVATGHKITEWLWNKGVFVEVT